MSKIAIISDSASTIPTTLRNRYHIFHSEYYNTHIIYDALEEDPEYHKRVLEHF